MSGANLFHDLAQAETERFDTLLACANTRIERIVSWGQASPPGFWYDQAEGEWVALLSGQARVSLLEPDELIQLSAGDWIWIAAHRRHRVDWTLSGAATVWLAVFVGAGEVPC